MPPKLLFDTGDADLSRIVYTQEQIREANPQRGAMEHLNAIVYCNPERGELVGIKDIRPDEFWVEGHIPGRPLLPGVIMIEAGAQLASFYTRKFIGWKGFIGFGGVDGCKFRKEVPPGGRMYLYGLKMWDRHKRVNCNIQGWVEGQLAFECSITGVEF